MAYTTVPKSTDYFTPTLYTGNGTSQSITGLNFQPSWVWIKSRSNSQNNYLYDAVRGASYQMYSDDTSGQNFDTGGVNSFNSDGFTIGSSGENSNGYSQVAWSWKANGQGSSNTDGTINTTYTSASTTSGLSISTYTGTGANATVGHGLGVAPKMVIVKQFNGSNAWRVYTEPTGNTSQMSLDTNGAADSGNTSMWNSTTPTSSVFSIGTHGSVNGSSNTYVAYCFADVKGYSKIGSYVGTGNANGPFQFLGFKPSWVLIKNTQANETWMLYDDKRGYNGSMAVLSPDETAAEISANNIDFLSNGFKIRTSASTLNTNNQTFVYMAFAEEPLVSTNGNAATAR